MKPGSRKVLHFREDFVSALEKVKWPGLRPKVNCVYYYCLKSSV